MMDLVNFGEIGEKHFKYFLPHYSTQYKTVKFVLFKSLTVRKHDHEVVADLRKAGTKSIETSVSDDPVIAVRAILRSKYARADVLNPQIFESMYKTTLEWHEMQDIESVTQRIWDLDCIDLVPLIAAREWFYGHPR